MKQDVTQKTDWKKVLVTPELTIEAVIERLNETGLRVVLVVAADHRLKGTVTDGDIRRSILKRIELSSPVVSIMNTAPVTATLDHTRSELLQLMQAKCLLQIPILDQKGIVVGLETIDGVSAVQSKENAVVIMAGGFGKRLQPLTDHCPKPLLKIGTKPLLEIILQNFIEYGFNQFYLSVGYKSEMIREYFGDGSKWNIQLNYLEEEKPLGTAGALANITDKISAPFIVMNGDIMTKVNFDHLLNFHEENNAVATMCVREYQHTVPYGVVDVELETVKEIREKPTQSYFINAGIYVLDPCALRLIPRDQYFDMPNLFQKLISEYRKRIVALPIHEYWLDIGRMEDYEKARDHLQLMESN